MKIYLITFVEADYDTYDSMCIIATSRGEARRLAIEKANNQIIKSINEINTMRISVPRILCASFNAG